MLSGLIGNYKTNKQIQNQSTNQRNYIVKGILGPKKDVQLDWGMTAGKALQTSPNTIFFWQMMLEYIYELKKVTA